MSYVLTLRMDAESQAFFEGMRRRYFPLERNKIPAHLTLFHTLPDGEEVEQRVEDAAREQAAFGLTVTGLRSLGGGVAYRLSSATLMALHTRLAAAFAEHLTAQDRQRLQPHVVVQNKVKAAEARELLTELERSFVPMQAQAEGLDLWRYLGGPWEMARGFWFSAGLGVGSPAVVQPMER